VDYLLTGSLPREIALYHVFGLDKGRGTADVDFGISVQSWEQFEQLRAAFLASGQFEKDFNPLGRSSKLTHFCRPKVDHP